MNFHIWPVLIVRLVLEILILPGEILLVSLGENLILERLMSLIEGQRMNWSCLLALV